MDEFIYDPPMEPYLDIVYQDDDLLVLNKPCGLLSVPGRLAIHKDSLESRVQTVFPTAKVVHRLDMSTSGIMLMALNKESHRNLSRQFETRQIDKEYTALLYGVPSQSEGEVNLPLICDWPNRPKQKVCYEHGKPSLTRWKLIEDHEHFCVVRLVPVTGRSHQLRVHMQSMGHPILGDKFYAPDEAFHMHPRLALHASFIRFNHPVTGVDSSFELPADFLPER